MSSVRAALGDAKTLIVIGCVLILCVRLALRSRSKGIEVVEYVEQEAKTTRLQETQSPWVASARQQKVNINLYRAQMLVLVPAGGDSAHFGVLRALWRIMARKSLNDNIHVFLLGYSEEVDKPTWQPGSRTLLFPGEAKDNASVLKLTLTALELIERLRLPGSAFKIFLKTNLTAFWRLKRFQDHAVKTLRNGGYFGTVVDSEQGFPYATGEGILFSKALVDMMLMKVPHLQRYWDETPDDVSVGRFFHEHLVKPKTLETCEKYTKPGGEAIELSRKEHDSELECFRWFVRGGKSETRDLQVMLSLVSRFYTLLQSLPEPEPLKMPSEAIDRTYSFKSLSQNKNPVLKVRKAKPKT